jgi:soluble lytic murein transglycosylase-like protein
VKAATTALCACVCLVLAPGQGKAEVRLGVGAQGRKVIFNENAEQRARRFAGRLVAVPDAALEPLILRHSGARRLDPRLVKAVIQVESGYNRRARSNKGAMGLMQLMPATASELAVSDPYDPDQNLRGGTAYLRQMIDLFTGNLELAVAAYNAGPAAVGRHRGVPPYPDTLDYVRRVLGLYRGADVAVSYLPGARPRPYVSRAASGRILLTTALR